MYAFGYVVSLVEGWPIQLLVAPDGEATACVRLRPVFHSLGEVGVYQAVMEWGKAPLSDIARLLKAHGLDRHGTGEPPGPGVPWRSFEVEQSDQSASHVFDASVELPPQFFDLRVLAEQVLEHLEGHPVRTLGLKALQIAGPAEVGASVEIGLELVNRGRERARFASPRALDMSRAMTLELEILKVSEGSAGPIQRRATTIDLSAVELRTGPRSALPTDRAELGLAAGGSLALSATVLWPRLEPGVYQTIWSSKSGGDPMEIDDWVSGRLEVRGPEVEVRG